MVAPRSYDRELNLRATELRLGLPGCGDFEKQDSPMAVKINKRASPEMADDDSRSSKASSSTSEVDNSGRDDAPSSKARIVGWPPVRPYRRNSLQTKKAEAETGGMYLKVSMDGAPYLRKVDLKIYQGYPELLKALQNMFKITIGEYSEREGYHGSEYAPTYEDKDGDWMLVGDVPWEMFTSSCKKLRIMRGSEAQGLGCM